MERSERYPAERRKAVRFPASQPVQATVLGGGHAPMPGVVVDVSHYGLGLQLPQAVAVGAAIQVEADDALLLGEIRYCQPHGDGYRVGLAIRHTLADLAQLRDWCRQLEPQHAAPETVRS